MGSETGPSSRASCPSLCENEGAGPALHARGPGGDPAAWAVGCGALHAGERGTWILGRRLATRGLLEKMSQFIPAIYAVGESPASHFIKDNNLDSAKR